MAPTRRTEEDREGEQMSDIFRKKNPEPEPKRTADTDADFLLPQFRPENSTITQRSKLFA